jgi:hypothetical protein
MSAFLFCFAAWMAVALGMDKHHEDALGHEAAPARLRQWRRVGWVILLASLWLAARTPPGVPASIGVTAWVAALSVAAVAATAAVTWLPQRAPPLGAVALAAGLLAYFSGM